MNNPRGIDADASENIFFTDAGNHRVRLLTELEFIETLPGSGPSGDLNGAFEGLGSLATEARLDTPRGCCRGR